VLKWFSFNFYSCLACLYWLYVSIIKKFYWMSVGLGVELVMKSHFRVLICHKMMLAMRWDEVNNALLNDSLINVFVDWSINFFTNNNSHFCFKEVCLSFINCWILNCHQYLNDWFPWFVCYSRNWRIVEIGWKRNIYTFLSVPNISIQGDCCWESFVVITLGRKFDVIY